MKLDRYYRALGVTGNEDAKVIKKKMKESQKYERAKQTN